MPETGEQQRQRVAENLRRLKAAKRPQAEIDSYLASERKGPVAEPMSGAETVGAGFETAFDAATLGLPSIIGDAVAAGIDRSQSFADVRKARAERKQEFREKNPVIATALEVGGSVVPFLAPGVSGIAATRLGAALTPARLSAAVPTAAKAAKWATSTPFKQAVAQGTVAGGAGEFGDEDDTSALQGARSGALGGLLGGGIGTVAGVVARGIPRVTGAWGKKLDEEALAAVKRMNAEDAVNYGKAAQEATTTPPITDALTNDDVLRPIADELRKEAAQKGTTVTDAQLAMDVYKRLSRRQRSAQTAMSKAEDYRPELESQIEMMVTAKDKLLRAVEGRSEVVIPGRAVAVDAPLVTGSSKPTSLRDALERHKTERARGMFRRADGRAVPGETTMQSQVREALDRRLVEGRAPQTTGAPASGRVVTRPSQTIEVEAGIPSLRAAIAAHRKNAAEIEALIEGADTGKRIGGLVSLPGKQLVKKGQASYLERIEEMTPEEANMAYTGILGRGREAIRASANPLGAFGVLPSTARSVIYPFLNRRILTALERKSGRKDYGTPWRKGVGGTLARLFGYKAGT